MTSPNRDLELELEYLRLREQRIQLELEKSRREREVSGGPVATAPTWMREVEELRQQNELLRRELANQSNKRTNIQNVVPVDEPGPKKRRLEPPQWEAFWADAEPLTVPHDPEQRIPRYIMFQFSQPVSLNMHGLFFQLAAFGELESVGVISKVTAYAQFVRAQDADRAQYECHGKRLAQLQTLVQVSTIDPALAEEIKVSVSFKPMVEHLTSLILFEPSPYEEKITSLVTRFWKNVKDKYLQSGQRRFQFLSFTNAADAQACLVTLQLRLAFDWDVHIQYVTQHEALLPGTPFRSTAEALNIAHPGQTSNNTISVPPTVVSPAVPDIQIGAEYRAAVRRVMRDEIEVDAGLGVRCTVNVADCDDPQAFRQLKVDDVVQPEVLAITQGPDGLQQVHMGLQRPDRKRPRQSGAETTPVVHTPLVNPPRAPLQTSAPTTVPISTPRAFVSRSIIPRVTMMTRPTFMRGNQFHIQGRNMY
eukprot:NODE_2529_length_1557_cov_35.549512_g2178_i0.p1 GENE.NODE_2529_length_1557_cov_35.549512_g2178_i0~~NODE_2529_length_1557_cov_35.549512_g2178_i0.p1  ORF type:complete len:494 (+),score=82.53 NODE_2529_length_1557_cov_35.549512_g2178_i0:54-1484(+)